MTNDDKPLHEATPAEIRDAMRRRLGRTDECSTSVKAIEVYMQLHRDRGPEAAERWSTIYRRLHGL